jgi:hypothetical protein
VGAPAALPGVRARRVLRRFQEQARHQALSLDAPPIMTSLEPGEDWSWCYIDEVVMELG